MASLIISSAAVTAVSRATSSQARQVVVVPFNGTKLSNSAVTQTHASSLVAAPFTGLKSNSTFPMSRKVDNITSLSSNGGRAKCVAKDVLLYDPLPITKATDGSWIPGNDGSIEFTGDDLKNWVEVDVSTLNRGKNYEVTYYVRTQRTTIVGELTLTTTDPDGVNSSIKGKYTINPGGSKGISFPVFRQTYKSGNMKFTFNSPVPKEWVGLIIEEAMILDA